MFTLVIQLALILHRSCI